MEGAALAAGRQVSLRQPSHLFLVSSIGYNMVTLGLHVQCDVWGAAVQLLASEGFSKHASSGACEKFGSSWVQVCAEGRHTICQRHTCQGGQQVGMDQLGTGPCQPAGMQ